jgi:hypothetical protein
MKIFFHLFIHLQIRTPLPYNLSIFQTKNYMFSLKTKDNPQIIIFDIYLYFVVVIQDLS